MFGSGFTQGAPVTAHTLPLPTELNGVRVRVNESDVPLYYVSASQVNVQCPVEVPGRKLSFTVLANGETSNTVDTTMQFASPEVFTLDGSGKGQGAILLANSAKVAMTRNGAVPSEPARPGDIVLIFAQGLGPVRHAVQAGEAAGSEPLSESNVPIRVLIGDSDGDVMFSGLAPGFVGLYQVNVRVPIAAPVGDAVPVSIRVTEPGGKVWSSNVVTLSIETN